MILYEITICKNGELAYRDNVQRPWHDAKKEILRLIRDDYSKGQITSLPMLEYLLIFEPGPRRLVAYAHSKPDKDGKSTDYQYHMDEIWPDDEKERKKRLGGRRTRVYHDKKN